MRVIGQPAGKKSQLFIVQETSLELVLQLGDQPKTTAIKKRRLGWLLNLAIAILVVGVISAVMYSLMTTQRNISMPNSEYYFFYAFFAIFIISSIMVPIVDFYRPCFFLWTFDRSRRQIVKTTTNLSSKTKEKLFSFQDVKSLQVEEHHDEKDTFTELYMVLNSGKTVNLSVSPLTDKDGEKATNFQYHQELAQKIRNLLDLKN